METASLKKTPLLNQQLRLFMLAMILANISSMMYMPLLSLYLTDLKANVAQVGLFFTLAQIIPLALQILGGWISDTLGRLRSIAYGSMAGVLGYVGLILAPTWQWVLVGQGLGSLTRSLVGPSFGAFIAEQSTEQNRARVYALSETLFNIVMIVGPPLGGWLAEAYGFKAMLLIAAVMYAVATAMRVWMAQHYTAPQQSTEKPKLALASLASSLKAMLVLVAAGGIVTWLLITDGVRDVGFMMSETLWPVYLKDIGGLSLKEVGLLNSVYGIACMVFNYPGGILADKKGERIGLLGGMFLTFAAMLAFLQVKGFWGFALVWALFGVSSGISSPAYQSLLSKAIPEKLRGTGFGLLNTSLGLFSLPAPAIGASLWERFGARLPFQITAWASLMVILPAWLKLKLPKEAKEPVSIQAEVSPVGD